MKDIQNEKIFIFNHPLIQHKVSLLRDKTTNTKDFRDLVEEISMLMAYEVTRDLELRDVQIETPVSKATVKKLKEKKITLVPVLRAGLGMVDGMQNIMPQARVGHIGLYRDPATLKTVEYYCKLPVDITESEVFVLDPMLATGVSAIDSIDKLKEYGVKNLVWLSIVASKEGLMKLHESHPDIKIFCAAVDEKLNADSYIEPGLGDAGDRLFGTK